MEDLAVTRFRDYLRLRTDHPNPDYAAAITFLKKIAGDLSLPYEVVEVHPGKVCLIMTWEGTDPSLPSIVLNSHTDVVPAETKYWKYDPFEAVKDDQGKIYARGTQDMKSTGMWYTEAIRRLKAEGKRLKRTIHLLFVPEEEVSSKYGMALFVKHDAFKKLNMGLALDEGLANPTDAFTLFYGERAPWWFIVTCKGNPGHGSRFIENTAASKARKIIESIMSFRDSEEKKLKNNACLKLGDVTTTNMNWLKGGHPTNLNVIPSEIEIGFDIRVATTEDLQKFEKRIAEWCKAAGEDVTYSFVNKCMCQNVTSTEKDDPWFKAFTGACDELGLKLELEIFPAATDSRFFRELNYPALGFSPINNTPILLHDHNEFLSEDVYLKGISIYCKIIPALANV